MNACKVSCTLNALTKVHCHCSIALPPLNKNKPFPTDRDLNFDLATQKIKKPKSTGARGAKNKKTDAEETKSRTVTPNLDVDEQLLIADSPTTSISATSTTLPNELKRSASTAQHDLDYHDEAKK